MKYDLRSRARKIRMLLFDVDGVMTDGGIILGGNGLELKKFSAQDGMGITLAKQAGMLVGIITGRQSLAVTQRAQELAIDEVFQGSNNKIEALTQSRQKYNVAAEEMAYIGDDLGDLAVMSRVGLAIAVANAVAEVKERAHYVTERHGGDGAIREVVDMILELKGIKEEIIARFLEG